jgi:hypothetical protein
MQDILTFNYWKEKYGLSQLELQTLLRKKNRSSLKRIIKDGLPKEIVQLLRLYFQEVTPEQIREETRFLMNDAIKKSKEQKKLKRFDNET